MNTIKLIGGIMVMAIVIVPQVLAECGPTWENPRRTSFADVCGGLGAIALVFVAIAAVWSFASLGN